jgi:hypothetical protein
MQITSFKISSDKSKMNLTIIDAVDVVSLRLWDHTTYKEFSDLIDLSDKLTGSSTENIEITPSDLGVNHFDGIYFIEAEDTTETSLEFTFELTKYKECATVKAVKVDPDDNCGSSSNKSFMNVVALYNSLELALEIRHINKILTLIETLDKYCTNKCQTCGDPVDDISSYENSNPDTITIIIDGGTSENK